VPASVVPSTTRALNVVASASVSASNFAIALILRVVNLIVLGSRWLGGLRLLNVAQTPAVSCTRTGV